MPILAYTPTVYVNDSAPPQNATNLNKTEQAIKTVTDEVITVEQRVTDLESPIKVELTPQATPPTYIEGQIYYDDTKKTFVAAGQYSDAKISVGHDMHVHVINNSGALIEKGMAVRHNGVDANGIVQIEKAIATSFTNARIFGVTQHDIADTAEGAIITFGEISGIDTSGVSAGVPLYLSDTTAGTFTATAPSIISQIGGATTSAVSGNLFVSIINNTTFPSIYGGLKNLTTPAVSVTTTSADITGYVTTNSSVVTVNATTGVITLPYAGAYRSNFVADISFTSATTTRSVTFEIYDATGTAIAYSYTKNIPRDATQDGLSFSFPQTAVVNNEVKMMVKASESMTITFNSIIFDIESVNIAI